MTWLCVQTLFKHYSDFNILACILMWLWWSWTHGPQGWPSEAGWLGRLDPPFPQASTQEPVLPHWHAPWQTPLLFVQPVYLASRSIVGNTSWALLKWHGTKEGDHEKSSVLYNTCIYISNAPFVTSAPPNPSDGPARDTPTTSCCGLDYPTRLIGGAADINPAITKINRKALRAQWLGI